MRQWLIKAATFCCVSLLGFGWAMAQDVTLTSRDGAVTISGTLLGYDGEFYKLDTPYGPLSLDGEGVDCTGVGCPDPQAFIAEFTISGSSTIGSVLMPALLTTFAQNKGLDILREVETDARSTFVMSERNSDRVRAKVHVNSNDTDAGFYDLIAGNSDVVMAMRPVRDDEVRLSITAGTGDLSKSSRVRVLALDGMVITVAPTNPLGLISPELVAQIFAGDITNWAEINGVDAPIQVHSMTANSGLAQLFEDQILSLIRKPLTIAANLHEFAADLVDAVAQDPFAIGYSTYSELGNAEPLKISGTCGIGVAPQTWQIKNSDYPLTSPLLVYTSHTRLPRLARDFLGFIASRSADIAIRRAGFVDQSLDTQRLTEQGEILANAIEKPDNDIAEIRRYLDVVRGGKKLSVSFHFKSGSTDLDVQSSGNLERLAQIIEIGGMDGKELIFVGHSDGEGDAGINQSISNRRSNAVLRDIRRAAKSADLSRVKLSGVGFGEVFPIACDDSEWGKRINRRVEVWIKEAG
ncbi:MAG: phosphate ABC transporter substrate-binding/OmpA family protein [Paracoccaceae bacterium]|nr:phosphate ABC transporter substrate-binding/OmpA family protein [Paracoccaceae bacterium]